MYKAAAWIVGGLLGAVLLALVFTLGYVSSDRIASDDSAGSSSTNNVSNVLDGDIDFDTLQQIVDILRDEYFDREALDEELLFEAAIAGMLDSLADTGTFYIDPSSYELSLGPSGSFEGIGATVNQQDNNIVIVTPFEGSPAELAGLIPGDIILAVDGESIVGWPLDRAVLAVRGPRGSEVTLTILHLDGSEQDFLIVREEIEVNSVGTSPPGGVLRDEAGNEITDIQYMRILQFTERTPGEVDEIVRAAEKSGMRGLIIDLRGNPGGLFDETLDTTDLFLDEGIMLIEVDDDDDELVYRASEGGAALNIPIAILMGPLSASGAEVLAAALKDNGRAIIIGETSFGKGTVNRARQLDDGGALFVTIRHWLTPKGVQIDQVGIRPDVEVTPGLFDPLYDPLADVQIFSALDHLLGLEASAQPLPSAAQ
ncbi:MAG: PDZ domain-containing protein [Chloroflexi bacterium]|nr:PDZ domain-containing protein [Chloroflexota bacterium]MCI0855538.1 PDZ domain-containing protein [Chloroflexota bacterium]MCI0889949.1 PDZ domain-containing protein [Chloroflexota bacterium]